MHFCDVLQCAGVKSVNFPLIQINHRKFTFSFDLSLHTSFPPPPPPPALPSPPLVTIKVQWFNFLLIFTYTKCELSFYHYQVLKG